ncbi:alkaline phosphatase, partial [Burkholderia multivorans]
MRYERLNAVLELLAENDHMSVNELADRLAVSTATVRRDLDHLSAQQLLTRTRGGAVSSGVADLPIKYKSAQRANEKERIGSLSASLVKPGMTVGMNGGTTASETAQALAQRADLA